MLKRTWSWQRPLQRGFSSDSRPHMVEAARLEPCQNRPKTTVADLHTPSQAFTASLPSGFCATQQRSSTNHDHVRQEIDRLLRRKHFDSLLSLLAKWTAPQREHDWQNTLQHRQLSHILGQIVKYQAGVIQQAATLKTFSRNDVRIDSKLAHARAIREGLRKVYSNLLGDGSSTWRHLYSKGRAYSAKFRLSASDVENLVMLELSNGKLDLASRWFQVLESQYPNHEHYQLMTYHLWLLKFQVYGGSKPSLWQVQSTQLYEKKINPRRGNLKSEMSWTEIFNDFVKHQAQSSGSSSAIFDKALVREILYSVAHKGNVAQVHKLIESNWGITSTGKMVKNFLPPQPSDPLYPDINVLQAIVISMLYNKRYVASLTYINAFQTHYAMDVGSKSAKHFWDQLFRWSEITTRFSEYRALHQYIKETNVKSLLGPTTAAELSVTLDEAKNLADFNYEGYLQYIADLTAQRAGLIKELWRCYQESGMEFSVRPYQTLLTLTSESRSEADCFDLLRDLAKQNDIYKVSPDSYNASMTRDKLDKVSELYTNTMKLLINIKGESGKMGTIPHILREWSLDPVMKASLQRWAFSQEARYLEVLNSMGEKVEDDDEFLGLL